MAKAVLKTQETDASVEEFLNSVENPERRADALVRLQVLHLLLQAIRRNPLDRSQACFAESGRETRGVA